MLSKTNRWKSRKYLDWVSSQSCVVCDPEGQHGTIEGGTVVAHHLAHRHAPWCGGMSYKANDWLVMPLCYTCHAKAHAGDSDILDWQIDPYILRTLDKAFREGILHVNKLGRF
jgi:hypothetical protein